MIDSNLLFGTDIVLAFGIFVEVILILLVVRKRER